MNSVRALALSLAPILLWGCAGTPTEEPVYQSFQTAPEAPQTSPEPARPAPATTAQTEPKPAAPAAPRVPSPAPAQKPLVTLAEGLNGKISTANTNLRFVVITFPVGQMARTNQTLNVYRSGLKVGELVVSGPQREDSIVADISAGEAQTGDEVRDR